MSLKVSYYRNVLLETHRGNGHGIISNAKPYLLLTIIKLIEDGEIIGNRIQFDNRKLSEIYNSIAKFYEPQKEVTPLPKPFFHLNREPFYYLKWKAETNIPKQATTPSAKFLRENVEYACLDEELWELLQDPETRNEFRDAIIRHFINPSRSV